MKALRVERNLLQAEFGEILGELLGTKRVSPSAVGSYERNEREPTYELLTTCATFFGVSTDYLLCHSDERLTVEDYLASNSMELQKALSDLTLTVEGQEITAAEKARLYDIAYALMWRSDSR